MEQKAYALTSRRRYLTRVVLYPALGSQTLAYLRYLVRNRWRMLRKPSALSGPPVPQKKRLLDRCGFWLFWLAVFGLAFWQGQVANLILFWFVPYLTSFQILGWYIELSEHTPMVRDQEVDLYMTRNRRSRGLEKWLTGIHCDDYHLDHHLNPRTPFWKLPEARKIRLADPNYAAVDAKTGGLFTKGPQGQPSALSQIVRALSSKKREDAGCVSS
jgi:fatty acid desaturase